MQLIRDSFMPNGVLSCYSWRQVGTMALICNIRYLLCRTDTAAQGNLTSGLIVTAAAIQQLFQNLQCWARLIDARRRLRLFWCKRRYRGASGSNFMTTP